MSRNNWKPLFEVNFSKNSTKTIRLFALNFYEVTVDEAFGFINTENMFSISCRGNRDSEKGKFSLLLPSLHQ